MSTKSDILAFLEAGRDRHISGQELAEGLSISRTAVWKAIKALESEGHKISAVPNKGYKLYEESDVLSTESIFRCLPDSMRENPIITYKTVDSTNTRLKKLALDGAVHGTILVSEEQTAGRGRGGKDFFSPSGTGLYMSVLLRPEGVRDPQMITVCAAVSVCRAIEALTGKDVQIKWVNDIYLDGMKICGILTEAATDFESGGIESIVVGVGVNCTTKTESFPENLRRTATSINGLNLSRSCLAAGIARGIMDSFKDGCDMAGVLNEYRSRSMLDGKMVSFQKNGKSLSGLVTGIDDTGGLMITLINGERMTLHSGEVSLGHV